jgi:hypothetical protein
MMSFDQNRMLESRLTAIALVRKLAPQVPEYVFRWSVAQQRYRTALSDARRGRWPSAFRLFALSALDDPRSALTKIWATLSPKRHPAARFEDYLPSEGAIQPSRLIGNRLRRLSEMDNLMAKNS